MKVFIKSLVLRTAFVGILFSNVASARPIADLLKKAAAGASLGVLCVLSGFILHSLKKRLITKSSMPKELRKDMTGFFCSIDERFDSVAGAAQAKKELQEIVAFLKNPEEYNKLGARMPRGVLLVGGPGNGKTLLAKAVAGEANCPFFAISGSCFSGQLAGEGIARVRDLFARARWQKTPAIIFIDEIDALGSKRGSGSSGSDRDYNQTLNQLLVEMDGFATSKVPVIVIAATNRVEELDKALLRAGRFDRHIEVPFPNVDDRKDILMVHMKKCIVDPQVDVAALARGTSGFSGADLANLVNEAALHATRNHKDAITQEDFHVAQEKLLEGVKRNHDNMYLPSDDNKKTFDSVAGVVEAKEELQDIIDFLKNPEKYEEVGAHIPRGVLLVGEPGNGKTLLAKAVAGEANCPFFATSGSDFAEMFVGVGSARVHDLFARARRQKTAVIIFIDEIDALGSRRGPGSSESDRDYNQTLNQLLVEMDGLATLKTPVIVIAATNRAEALDKALLRPGRFDRHVHVNSPDVKSREMILTLHLKKCNVDPQVDIAALARGTGGFSGADLANLVNEAAVHAVKNKRGAITRADFEEARDKVLVGKESKTIILSDYERKVTAYHEAGHALVRLMMPTNTDPLHKITIIPRGGALGVTWCLPEEEKNIHSKEEMEAILAMLCGGRVAEELVFNSLMTGASNDFTKATDLARKMVCSYGMHPELGAVVYGNHSYSEQTAYAIDNAVKFFINQALAKAKKILQDNRDKLDKLAHALLEEETLSATQVYELLGIEPRLNHAF